MGVVSTLIAVAALAGPPVEVSTFVGENHKGELTALADGQLTLQVDGQEKKLALTDVLEVRFATKEEARDSAIPEVILTDGSRLNCKSVASTEKVFTLETASLGNVEIPAASIGSVRLAPQTNALTDAWSKLTQRSENSDLLALPKGELLDFLKGVVGSISEEKVKFLVGGNPYDVNRQKVYGIVYGNRKPPATIAICRAMLPNKDTIEFKSLTWTGETFQAELVAGSEITLPVEKLTSLDFSLGKVQFLSDITPRKKTITPPIAIENEPACPTVLDYHDVQINRNFSGQPLKLGGKVYSRGLCIHSKTELMYRLSKEMRRFQAVMGIDDFVAEDGHGDVHVTIRADGKPLLETLVQAGDKPRELDLDVTGVVVLEIIVDFNGLDSGVGDHLDLADAKFIK